MARTLMQPNMPSVPSQIGSFEDKEIRTFLAKAQLNCVLDRASKDASSSRLPSRLLKNHFGTGATQHSRRSGTASEQPAGWSKRPSSAATASEKAKGGAGEAEGGAYSVRYVEPPSAARTKLADPSAMLRAGFFNNLLGRNCSQLLPQCSFCGSVIEIA